MVNFTENAAKHIENARKSMKTEGKLVRLAVAGGGCTGRQYQLGFDAENETDIKFITSGLTVLVDERSLEIMGDMEVDFVEDSETGRQFTFKSSEAPVDAVCGCGKDNC
ncbi:hypothetical protein MNBD_NITROSPINAE01-879 [hydrothermal vent metagenome]|uniref:Core domain-containing protein n=1 Tax=hydrothermal vent metagenome TaxID=652676 RepID=A0A3B1CC76_9ZZZZ